MAAALNTSAAITIVSTFSSFTVSHPISPLGVYLFFFFLIPCGWGLVKVFIIFCRGGVLGREGAY